MDEEKRQRKIQEANDHAIAQALQEKGSTDDTATLSPGKLAKNPQSSTNTGSTAAITATAMTMFQNKNADSGYTATFGLIPKIRHEIEKRPSIALHLTAECALFSSDPEDMGWSCGYRNLQTILSAGLQHPILGPHLHEQLQGRYIPSILHIQRLIEKAWAAGWDPQGKQDHNGRLAGTVNWIGPVDLYSMLMSLRVECRIISFVHDHPNQAPHSELFRWCENLFMGYPAGTVLPLYLQHAGHSRTIVGQNKAENGSFLVIFDPNSRKEDVREAARPGWLMEHFLRSSLDLRDPAFEILYVTGKILSVENMTRAKRASQTGITGETFLSI